MPQLVAVTFLFVLTVWADGVLEPLPGLLASVLPDDKRVPALDEDDGPDTTP